MTKLQFFYTNKLPFFLTFITFYWILSLRDTFTTSVSCTQSLVSWYWHYNLWLLNWKYLALYCICIALYWFFVNFPVQWQSIGATTIILNDTYTITKDNVISLQMLPNAYCTIRHTRARAHTQAHTHTRNKQMHAHPRARTDTHTQNALISF